MKKLTTISSFSKPMSSVSMELYTEPLVPMFHRVVIPDAVAMITASSPISLSLPNPKATQPDAASVSKIHNYNCDLLWFSNCYNKKFICHQ